MVFKVVCGFFGETGFVVFFCKIKNQLKIKRIYANLVFFVKFGNQLKKRNFSLG